MKTATLFKSVGSSLAITAFFAASTANAQSNASQMRVNKRVQISGSCSKCDLSNKVMPRISLQHADFSGSDFSHSNLSGGKFNHSNLAGASFNKAYLMKVEGVNVNLHNSVLRDATLSEATIINSNISQADLRRADLSHTDFSQTSFLGSAFDGSDATDANFTGANLTSAHFDHANFSGADFSNAQLIGVDFAHANVTNTNFIGSNLSGANVSSAVGLKPGQLEYACGDQTTILPQGYVLPLCNELAGPQENMVQMAPSAIPPQQAPATIVVPTAPQQKFPLYNRVKRETVRQVRNLEIDMAMRDIDAAMRDLPMESPTRTKLQSAKDRLIKASGR